MNILTLINEVELSVPIRGLFNLTFLDVLEYKAKENNIFRPHQGII